jgi:E3 ubiquitin-protein ligase UBR4
MKVYSTILLEFITNPSVYARFKKLNAVTIVFDAFLTLRSLLYNRTKFTSEAETSLNSVLDKLTTGSKNEAQSFIIACFESLSKRAYEGNIRLFLFEKLCNIICPDPPKNEVLLILEKKSTQEEFIRGRMSKNPYRLSELITKDSKVTATGDSSAETPTMRDIKNRICEQLELFGLVEDDFGMELLVHDKIIKLELPVEGVYEHVWKPHFINSNKPNTKVPPMVVVYRLQGLDGEATEDIVDSIEASDDEDVNTELKYEITKVLQQCDGLVIMIKMLSDIVDFKASKNLTLLILKLLSCSMIKSNILALICDKQFNAVELLLNTLINAFSKNAHVNIIHRLLLLIETLVEAANENFYSTPLNGSLFQDHEKLIGDYQLSVFLEKMNDTEITANNKVSKAMASILPYLTYGRETNINLLLSHFSSLNFVRLDVDASLEKCMIHFCQMVTSLKENSTGTHLKMAIIRQGIVDNAVNYISECIPEHIFDNNGVSHDNYDISELLSKPSLPYALEFLAGMARNNLPSQKIIQKCIKPLHVLERVTSLDSVCATKKQSKRADVGTLAENLLESLTDPVINEAVQTVREATKASNRRLALAKRNQLLKEMGFKTEKGKTIIVPAEEPIGMGDLAEDSGHTCLICREGYLYKSEEVLGVYVYYKKILLDDSDMLEAKDSHDSSDCVGSSNLSQSAPLLGRSASLLDRKNSDFCIVKDDPFQGYSTVSHFNIVHFSCHEEAVRIDKTKGRHSLSEWEGATLRNDNTKTNNLFPICGPNNNMYPIYVEKYFCRMSISNDLARFRCVVHDLKTLLKRFACRKSFSEDSLGGGRESNIGLVIYQLQLGLYLLDVKGDQRKVFAPLLFSFLETYETEVDSPDNALYFLALSLFIFSHDDWLTHRCEFLKRVIRLAHSLYNSEATDEKLIGPRNPSNFNLTNFSEPAVFSVYKPFIVYWIFIDQIQQFTKGAECFSLKNKILKSPRLYELFCSADLQLLEMAKKMLKTISAQCESQDCFEALFSSSQYSSLIGEETSVISFLSSFLKKGEDL